MRERTVLQLFGTGKVSAGYAATLLGLDRGQFEAKLAEHRISPFNCSRKEFDKEFEVVRKLAAKLGARK